MSTKRKISIRRIIQAALTLVLAGVCVTAIVSATKLQHHREINDVDIYIKNDCYKFVDEQEIKDILLQYEDTGRAGLERADVKQMEEVVSNNPWVEDAQVYIDNERRLKAYVIQREPVVRIFEKGGNSYYLDKNNEPLPLSGKYNFYTLVVTNVPELKDDSTGNVLKGEIRVLTDFIKNDTFWNAQVSQVIVADEGGFEIVPVLGEQKILLGDTVNMKQKFSNLFAFYKNVLNEVGWDKYEVLDLRYRGQLVASPSLPWKMPVDKVINRINWVNSILGVPMRQPVVINTMASTSQKEQKTADTGMQVQLTIPKLNVQPPAELPKEVIAKAGPAAQPVMKQANTDAPSPQKQQEKETKSKTPKYIYNGANN